MTRKYSIVIEGDPTGYSAYVPELPTILVTGRAAEAI
jgi:predicted RNase H-like HicB family nuclease